MIYGREFFSIRLLPGLTSRIDRAAFASKYLTEYITKHSDLSNYKR